MQSEPKAIPKANTNDKLPHKYLIIENYIPTQLHTFNSTRCIRNSEVKPTQREERKRLSTPHGALGTN
jgi:hypothetical protein